MAFVAAISNGETPLNVLQLLWVNLIMDSLAALGELGWAGLGRVRQQSRRPGWMGVVLGSWRPSRRRLHLPQPATPAHTHTQHTQNSPLPTHKKKSSHHAPCCLQPWPPRRPPPTCSMRSRTGGMSH